MRHGPPTLLLLILLELLLPPWSILSTFLRAEPVPTRPVDSHGDPLPPGARARLGTARFRTLSPIRGLCYSPDGKQVATIGLDGQISVLSSRTGQLLRSWQACRATGSALAYSPDGTLLASAGEEGGLRTWQAATGKLAAQLGPQDGCVLSLTFLPGRELLAAGRSDGTIELYDGRSGRRLRQWEDVEAIFVGLSASPDGKLLASAGLDALRLADVSGRSVRKLSDGLPGTIRSVAFSPDGKSVVCGSHDGRIAAWDAATGKRLWQSHPSQGTFTCLAFAADGKTLAAAGEDGVLYLVEAATGKVRERCFGHAGIIHSLAFSTDGTTLLTAGTERMLRQWETATGKPVVISAGHADPVWAVSFAPNGKYLASAGGDGTLRLWDTATARQLASHTSMRHGGAFVAFAPREMTLVSGGNEEKEELALWTVDGKQLHRSWTHPSRARGVCFTPDGRSLLSVGGDGEIRILETATGKLLRHWSAAKYELTSVAVSPDGSSLVCAGRGGSLALYEVASGRAEAEFHSSGHWIWSVQTAPDGSLIAAVEQGNKVTLWETATGKRVHTFASSSEALFSPDGQMLTCADDEEGGLHLWDVLTGQEITRWKAPHGGRVLALDFSPDGTLLASGGQDGTILLWDVAHLLAHHSKASPSQQELDLPELWKALGSYRPDTAYPAIAALAASPGQSIPFLQERLAPVAGGADRARRLLAELDSDEFTVRENASRELEKLGELVEPALRKAQQGHRSPELDRRINSLLRRLQTRGWTPDHLRFLRAISVLERARTPQARHLLKQLSEGVEQARLTRAATNALRCVESSARLYP